MNEPLSLDAASAAMRQALQESVKRNSWLYLIQGVVMILAGLLVFVFPLLSSLALAVFLGWMLIFAGIVQGVSLFGAMKMPHFWLQLVSAILSIVTGFLFLRNPGAAVATLALLLVVFFMLGGMAKVFFSLSVRPLPNWGWMLASGILGVLISAYLLTNPALSLLVLDIFIGVQLISEGVAFASMAWRARST